MTLVEVRKFVGFKSDFCCLWLRVECMVRAMQDRKQVYESSPKLAFAKRTWVNQNSAWLPASMRRSLQVAVNAKSVSGRDKAIIMNMISVDKTTDSLTTGGGFGCLPCRCLWARDGCFLGGKSGMKWGRRWAMLSQGQRKGSRGASGQEKGKAANPELPKIYHSQNI